MTIFDEIKNMSESEMANFLCELSQITVGDCEKCIATNDCICGKNGFHEWIKKDYDEFEGS